VHEPERSRRITLDASEPGARVVCLALIGGDTSVDDLVAELAQVGEEPFLVLQPALLQDGQLGVIACGPLDPLLEAARSSTLRYPHSRNPTRSLAE